jgi:hypothetical protein
LALGTEMKGECGKDQSSGGRPLSVKGGQVAVCTGSLEYRNALKGLNTVDSMKHAIVLLNAKCKFYINP